MHRRRRLVLVSLLAVVLSLIFGSSARAYPQVGISQSFRDYGLNLDKGPSYNPDNDVSRSVYWAPLEATKLRVIVPWDIADRAASDGRVQEFVNWLSRVKELGAEPFVVFGPTERASSTDTGHEPAHFSNVTSRRINPYYNGNTETATEALVPPPTTVYRTAIEDFLATWGPGTGGATGVAEVRTIGAWNEPNVGKVSMGLPGGITGPVILAGGSTRMWETQGSNVCPSGSSTDSNCGPLAAARFWNNARAAMSAVCSTCKVVAGEFDSDGLTNGPRFWALYAEKIEKLGSDRPQVMSFHGHHDAEALGEHVSQDCTSTNTQYCITRNFGEWLKGLGKPWSTIPIWDTEVGAGHFAGTSPSSDDIAQRNRFNNLINLEETYGVSRFYYYNFQHQGGVNDRSLIDSATGPNPDGVNARPRPIWDAIRCRSTGCAAWPVPAPAVNTGGVANVTNTSATATGLVDPHGQPTGTFIEYGPTTSYGRAALTGEISKNRTLVWLSANLTGLAPGTTYHYRFGASSPSGWTYGADQTFKTGGTPAESDVDGDHISDLVTLHTNGYVYDYPGQSNGYLASGVPSFSGSMNSAQFDETGYYPIDVEDVNGDAHDDLVAVDQYGDLATSLGQAGGYLSAWTYSLNGQITPAVLKASPGKYEPIAVADVNGDGRGDFIAYNNSDKTVYTFPGLASGEFSAGKVASLAGVGDSATFDSAGDYFIDAADVNGDGRADLVSQNTSGYARTYLGNASGGFSSSPVQSFGGVMAPSMATGSGWEPVGLGDVNGDGRADFVTVHSNGYVYTYLANPDGSFLDWKANFEGAADSSLYDGSGIEFMGVLDMNGDGFADMLTAQSDGNVRIYPGQANGYFGNPTVNFSGNFTSTRANHSNGFQPVVEKPLKRRNGCAANGCH